MALVMTDPKEACLRQVVTVVNEAIEALETVVKSEVPQDKCSWCLYKMGGYMTRVRRLINDLREQNEELVSNLYYDHDDTDSEDPDEMYHLPYDFTQTLREILALLLGCMNVRLFSVMTPEQLELVKEKIMVCYETIDDAILEIEGGGNELPSDEVAKKSWKGILKAFFKDVRYGYRNYKKCKCPFSSLDWEARLQVLKNEFKKNREQ